MRAGRGGRSNAHVDRFLVFVPSGSLQPPHPPPLPRPPLARSAGLVSEPACSQLRAVGMYGGFYPRDTGRVSIALTSSRPGPPERPHGASSCTSAARRTLPPTVASAPQMPKPPHANRDSLRGLCPQHCPFDFIGKLG